MLRQPDLSQTHMRLSLLGFAFLMNGCGNAPPADIATPVLPERISLVADEERQIESMQPLAAPDTQLPPQEQLPLGAPTLPEANAQLQRISDETPSPVVFDVKIVAAFEKLTRPSQSFEDWERVNQELLDFGSTAVPLLAQRLEQGNPIERELAASTLVSLGPDAEAAINSLRKSLKDELPFVRANAAASLVQFPEEHPRAIPVLFELLEHADSNLQHMAAMNLAVLGQEATPHVAQLTQVLEKKATDPDTEVLLPVVQLLGRIGPAAERAIPRLKQIAFEQKGEVGEAAHSAIQLIQTTTE